MEDPGGSKWMLWAMSDVGVWGADVDRWMCREGGVRRRSATGARWMCKGKKEGACGGVIDERGVGE